MTTILKNTLSDFFSGGISGKKTLIDRLVTLQSVYRERRILSEMGAERLDDIGISAKDARTESHRAAWDAPERWLR